MNTTLIDAYDKLCKQSRKTKTKTKYEVRYGLLSKTGFPTKEAAGLWARHNVRGFYGIFSYQGS